MVLVAWLLADFISGLVHWYEDRVMADKYGNAYIQSILDDNDRHHKMPGFLTRYSYWENINTTAPYAWAIGLSTFMIGAPVWLWLTFVFLGFGNLVHRWSHESPSKLPRVVWFIQKTGLFASASHHAGHHYVAGKAVTRKGAKIRYCVMTNWLNPILDHIRFFQFMEICLRVDKVDISVD